jgi:hypothetical protein
LISYPFRRAEIILRPGLPAVELQAEFSDVGQHAFWGNSRKGPIKLRAVLAETDGEQEQDKDG